MKVEDCCHGTRSAKDLKFLCRFTAAAVREEPELGSYQGNTIADLVHFTQPPVEMGPVTTAVLDDTCGNLIQIAQRR